MMSEIESETSEKASNKPKGTTTSTSEDKKSSKTKPSTKSKPKTSATAKKDKAKEDEKQRLADTEKKIRRRIALGEKAFRIVEQLLDNPVEEEFLLDVAKYILPSHFTDVVEERSIIHQCGYPVCRNMLKNNTKQKYHISLKSNQVYDISEGKKFCSNQCFKATKYFEKQLSSTPLWLREGEQIGPFHLLHRDADRSIAGDVMFLVPGQEIAAELRLIDKLDHLSLHDSDNRDNKVTKKPQTKRRSIATDKDRAVDGSLQDGSQDILMSEHATSCGISLSPGMDFGQPIAASLVGGDSSIAAHGRDVVVLDTTSSSGQTDVTTGLPETDMPMPSSDIVHCSVMTPVEACAKMDEENKTEALMQMLDRKDDLQTELDQHRMSVEEGQDADTARSSSPHHVADSGTQEDMPKQDNKQDNKEDVPKQANREDMSKQDNREDMPKQDNPVDVVSCIEHVQVPSPICDKVHTISIPAVSGATNSNAVSEHGCVSSSQALANIQRLRQMQSHKGSSPKAKKPGSHMDTIWGAVHEWKTAATVTILHGAHSDKDSDDDDDVGPRKLVASEHLPTAPALQGEEKLFQKKVCHFYRGVYPADGSDIIAGSPKKSSDEEIEIVMPPVDSHSQMALRRKIVLDKLTKALPVLLSPLKLSLSGLAPEIRQLVHTFRLTSENILFRPAEWTLLGLILLKVLCVKVEYLRSAFAQTYAIHYFRSFVMSMKINETDVEEVVDFLRSTQVQ